jgi:hypothetical protein
MKNKILFISSTHGNESFSIPVFEALEKDYPRNVYKYDWIIGNAKAVEKDVRFIDTDLNRSAPGSLKSNVYEEHRAAEIIELSKEYEMVIDVHGTRSDFGIVKIIPYPSYANLLLAGMFPVTKNVVWYSNDSIQKGPLVQFTHCPAIELECGDKQDSRTAILLKQTLIEFLENMKNPYVIMTQFKKQEIYSVYGKETNDSVHRVDFEKVVKDNETFYPFLTKNGYSDVSYYKMKKILMEELFDDRNKTQ